MVDVAWTAGEIRGLRDALRLSRAEFARHLGVTVRTLTLWETGRTTRIRAANRRTLHAVLATADEDTVGRFRQAVGKRDAVAETIPSPAASVITWTLAEELTRREFGTLSAPGAVLATTGAATAARRIGAHEVRTLHNGIAYLEHQDQRSGGGRVLDTALRELAKAKYVLETCAYGSSTGTAFLGATGELAVMAGWLAYDTDRQLLARRCYSDALALATEADNDDLIAHTCLYAANQSVRLARAGEGGVDRALHLVARARTLMRGRPPGRMHVLIAVREAWSRAVLADRPAFERAITTAWREMDYASAYESLDECPYWLRSVNHAEVAGHEARGLAELGEYDRAIDLLAVAADNPSFGRNALNAKACSAAYRARSGDIGGAVAEALPVLEALRSLTSTRTLRELHPLRHITTDSEFRDRFDSVADATAAIRNHCRRPASIPAAFARHTGHGVTAARSHPAESELARCEICRGQGHSVEAVEHV